MQRKMRNQDKGFIGIIIVIILVILISGGLYFYLRSQTLVNTQSPQIQGEVKNFEECANKGYQILDSSPRQCKTPEGVMFTEEIQSEEPIIPPENKQEEPPKPTCQNGCSSAGLKKCTNNGYQTCGDFNNDSCLEWSSVTNCLSNTICQNGSCIQQKCSNGTLYGQCSTSKPKYCENGNLINRCSVCGCLDEQECKIDESCVASVSQIVAIFVDTNTYNSLKFEVDRYVTDVNNDSGLDSKLFVGNFSSPQQVRDELLKLKGQNFGGSVLIGNIPIPYFEGSQPFVYTNSNVLTSDRYYMDLERTDFIDNDKDVMFEWDAYQGKLMANAPKLYWSGRIKIYNDDIGLLKNYFDRNHLYRTKQIQSKRQLMVYSPDTQSGPVGDTPEIYEDNMKDIFSRSGLYTRDQISLFIGISKSVFLNELSKDYESASISAHGDPYSQQIGEDIKTQDINEVKPKPRFYFLLSCSNADFSKSDYLAGHYLFDGNGLGLIGYTMPVLVGADQSHFFMEILSKGDTLGQALVEGMPWRNELQSIIIGDPTLRLRF